MRKLFKKSLACVLAVALCLTAMVGVLTVSAADAIDGTIAIADVTIEAGSTTATIPVTFTVAGEEADLINTGYIYYEINGANVTRIYDSVGDLGTNTEAGMFEIWLDNDGASGLKVAEVKIDVAFTAETESFTLRVYNNTSATNTEKLINFGEAEKTFTIEEPVVEHQHVLADAVIENNVPATCYAGGSYDSVVYCTAEGCDLENNEYSRETITVPATGEHTPADPVEENRVEAKPGVAGSYDSVVYCSVSECKHEISRTTIEIPALPAAEDTTLKFASASVGYGTSSLEMTFRVMKTVVSNYDSFDVIITPNKYNTSTFNLETPVSFEAPLTDKGTFYEYKYTDIQLYELGLTIEYMIKAYDADGNYVAYASYSTTPAEFLISTYGKSSDAKLRTLIADTLVVGDTAAKTFGKEGSALADAESIIKDFDTSEATQSYGTPNSVNTHNAINPDYNTPSGSTRRVNLGVAIGKVPYINYRIQNCKDLDIDKLSINVSYTQTTGVGATQPYNYTFTSADNALTKNESNGLITLQFDQIGLADASKDITFTVTYDGEEVCNTIYSIETFLGASTNNATIGNIAVALLNLSASATAKLA